MGKLQKNINTNKLNQQLFQERADFDRSPFILVYPNIKFIDGYGMKTFETDIFFIFGLNFYVTKKNRYANY